MGQSMTITVFYGARLPDPEEGGPRPRLTQAAVDAIPPRSYPIERDDVNELERHATLGSRLAFPRSGVGDYTWAHIAIASATVRSYDCDSVALTALDSDPEWESTIREALGCLEWTEIDYDGDEEIERVVAAPEIPIGWFVAASYW